VCVYANVIFVAAEGLDFSRTGIIGTGERSCHQATCPLWKGFWLDDTLGVGPRSVGMALADGLCDLGGKSLELKASMTGEGGPCPFELCLGICLATEEKHGKPQSGLPSSWRLLVAQTYLPFYGQPRLACWTISPPRSPVGDFSQPLVGTGAFQVAEVRGSPYHLTLSWNPVSDLMWSANNGIPKSSFNLPVTNVPKCISGSARTLAL
jgi:hypothetical protein